MKRFNNSTSFFLGLLSLIVQVVLIELLFFAVWFQNLLGFLFIFIWLIKSTVDFLFFQKIAQHIGQKVRWFNIFLLEPVYMIFVPFTVVFSLFKSPKWKGRKINE